MLKLAPTSVRDRFTKQYNIAIGKYSDKAKMIWVHSNHAGRLPSTFEDHLIVYYPF